MKRLLTAAIILFTAVSTQAQSSEAMEKAMPLPAGGRMALDRPLVALMAGMELQVTNPAPPATNYQSFPQQVITWIGSVDTNSVTFSIDNGSIWTGASYISGADVASVFGISYNLPAKFEARALVFNSPGIAQGIVGLEGGFGYHIFGTNDVRLTGFLDGGYDFNVNHPYIDPGFDIKKALGLRAFVGLSADMPIDVRGANHSSLIPRVTVTVGTTF